MLLCIVLIILCISFWVVCDRLGYDITDNFFTLFIPIFIAIIAGICLVMIPLSKYDNRVFINKINTVKRTLYQQRREGSLENAAITQKILDYNNDIADLKYNRQTFFIRDFVSEDIDTVTYIK